MCEIVTPEAINDFLRERGQTKKWLARLLGYDTGTVFRWCSGERKPTGTARLILIAMLADNSDPESTRFNLAWVNARRIYLELKQVYEPEGGDDVS